MDTDLQHDGNGGMRPGAIAAGAIMLVLGGTMLLDTTGFVDVPIGRLIGPFVLITLGSLMIVEKGGVVYGFRECTADGGRRMRTRQRGGITGGLWLIGVGVWLLISQTHLFGLDFHNSWPLFIILGGVMMLIRGVR
jgi:hypothetical protein